MDEKPCKIFLVYEILYKTLIDCVRFVKIDEVIRFHDRSSIHYYLVVKNVMPFTVVLARYLISQKMVLHVLFLIIRQELKLIHMVFLPLENTSTLHNFIILVKSAFNEDQNHYYYNIFLKKNNGKNFFHSIIILKFGEEKVAKKIYDTKKSITICDVYINNIVIAKLVEIKTNSKYLIGYLDKVMRPLVLILSKMSGYAATFKVKDGNKDKNNKLMSFRIDGEKLLRKYKTIWTKIEDFKNFELNTLPVYDDR